MCCTGGVELQPAAAPRTVEENEICNIQGKRGAWLSICLISAIPEARGIPPDRRGIWLFGGGREGGDPLTKRRLTQEERGEVKEYWLSTASVDKSDASNTGQTLIRLLDDDWNVDKNDKQQCKARIERENCSPVWVVSQLQGPGMPHVTHLNLHPSFHGAVGIVN